jgi:hypothetical protein
MDKTYADTVRLRLTVTLDVFADAMFAMKRGAANSLLKLHRAGQLSVTSGSTFRIEADSWL